MVSKEFKATVHDVYVDEQPITTQSRDVFEDAIVKTASLDRDARWQPYSDKPRRLEHYEQRGPLHLMNFVTAEFAGPGRTGQGTPVTPIGLRQGEYFAHETVALYDPDQGAALFESALGGVGPGALKGYLKQFNPSCIVSLARRVDPQASVKARGFDVFRRLHLQVSMGPVTEVDRRLGTGVLQSLGADYHAQLIDVVIKAGRTKDASLTKARIKGIIDAVIHARGDLNFEKCQVYGREEEDTHFELVDLISQPLKSDRLLPVNPETRKVSHEDKWSALVDIYSELMQS